MKKLTLCSPLASLLLIAVTIVSCHKPDPDVPAEDVAISMASSVSDMASSTRAGVIENLTEFQNNQGTFGVFGWKDASIATNSLLLFDNVPVTWASNRWLYTNIRYWDKSANHYYFGAYAPHFDSTGSGITANAVYETGSSTDSWTFKLDDIPNWQLAGGAHLSSTPTPYDLMVAHDHNTPSVYLADELDGENNVIRRAGVVNLEFSHILSMLKVYVSYPSLTDGYLYDYEITNISVGDGDGVLPKADGTSLYTMNYKPNLVSSTYTYSNPVYGTKTAGTSSVIYSSSIGGGVSALKNPQLVCSYLVIPFSGTTASENITLTVTYNEVKYPTAADKAAKTNAVSSVPTTTSPIPLNPAVSAFEPGKIYEANIIFDKGKIVNLTAVYIKNW